MINFLKNIFKKDKRIENNDQAHNFNFNGVCLALAYEVARSDGEITSEEQSYLLGLIHENENKEEIINQIKVFSENSVSFYDYIKDINKSCSLGEKELLLQQLWNIAYSDNTLEVNEEKIIRRVASMLNIKDIKVLRFKDRASKSSYK